MTEISFKVKEIENGVLWRVEGGNLEKPVYGDSKSKVLKRILNEANRLIKPGQIHEAEIIVKVT